jgi:maltooligosyltrehalose trehalohydrolase
MPAITGRDEFANPQSQGLGYRNIPMEPEAGFSDKIKQCDALMEETAGDILGATPLSTGKYAFLVWAPSADRVNLRILNTPCRSVPMERLPRGYFRSLVEEQAGCRYLYDLGGKGEKMRPDPASRSQPEGVHGPSEVPPRDEFQWTDREWSGMPLRELVFYELHVGTFTLEGSFDAIIPRLDELKDLGVTAIELMPVAQFPGQRNWGYDGVFPFCVQNSYGGPAGLKRFVNACHKENLCVALDVVYNHLGPEGNYLPDFGPYFTDRYRTPWGQAINFDGEWSDEVRRFFTENALYWIRDFHIDILRLDAVQAIVDKSAKPFLRELNATVRSAAARLNRHVHLIAECDRNDIRTVQPAACGGYGFAAQWNDDFHHAVHAVLTNETDGYYQDFGQVSQIAKSLTGGYVYQGEYSKYRLSSHGSESKGVSGEHFVAFTQNHDQIGNRMNGERLSHLVDLEAAKVAAGVMLLSPFLPLIFMGEEYGETSPFQYFVSHQDPQLIEAVRQGRKNEFKGFGWKEDPPDPRDEATFLRSQLNWRVQRDGPHRQLRDFYAELLRIRKRFPAMNNSDMSCIEATPFEEEKTVLLYRWSDGDQIFACFNFGKEAAPVPISLPQDGWKKVLNSCDQRWAGPGSSLPDCLPAGSDSILLEPLSFAVYRFDKSRKK